MLKVSSVSLSGHWSWTRWHANHDRFDAKWSKGAECVARIEGKETAQWLMPASHSSFLNLFFHKALSWKFGETPTANVHQFGFVSLVVKWLSKASECLRPNVPQSSKDYVWMI